MFVIVAKEDLFGVPFHAKVERILGVHTRAILGQRSDIVEGFERHVGQRPIDAIVVREVAAVDFREMAFKSFAYVAAHWIFDTVRSTKRELQCTLKHCAIAFTFSIVAQVGAMGDDGLHALWIDAIIVGHAGRHVPGKQYYCQ